MSENRAVFSKILGNEALKARLQKDILENRLSHAYIIEGRRGSGRHTFALQVATALECEARFDDGEIDLFGSRTPKSLPCGECIFCRKISEGKIPDIVTISLEDKKSIGVDSIRELKNDMVTAPNDLSHKYYIIEDADLMTEQAQNALLLSLEEPPEYVVFFLICSNASNLLETIRSRAPILRTEAIDDATVKEQILKLSAEAVTLQAEDSRALDTVVFIANGAIGRALELLNPSIRAELFEKRHAVTSLITHLGSKNRAAILGSLTSLVTESRTYLMDVISLLQNALRDLLVLKKCDSAPLCFFVDKDEAMELSTRYTAVSLVSLYDATVTAKKDIGANANTRLSLLNMMQNASII